MAYHDLFCRYPNLAQPLLVHNAYGKQSITFQMLFAGVHSQLDLQTLLKGACFLQPLKDTHEIIQERFNSQYLTKKPASDMLDYVEKASHIDNWPEKIKRGLIPLNVIKVDQPISSAWEGLPSLNNLFSVNLFTHCYYAYWVTLQVEKKYLVNLKVPELFNVFYKNTDGRFNVNFHAVYIHNQEWHDFNILQASDSHVAWRNDFIQPAVQNTLGPDYGKNFVNFNDNFRTFIQYANHLWRAGKADLILLTGDLVDHIEITRKHLGISGRPADNFFMLRNLVTAWQTCPEMIVGEELEVPLFTMLGNHDYRPAEYPTIATYELLGGADLYTLTEYESFFLSREEALAYESGLSKDMPYFDATTGIQHQSSLKYVHPTYRACLNPDIDFVITLGKHRIICLDSGPDKGEITGIMDGLILGLSGPGIEGSRYDRQKTTPDSTGFSAEQIQFVEDQTKNVDGFKVIACHSPIINYRSNPPPHMFRESEHNQLSDLGLVDDLRATLEKDEYLRHYEALVREYLWFQNEVRSKCDCKDPDPTCPILKMQLWDLRLGVQSFTFEKWASENGWSLENTDYFKKGEREPELGRGVPDERFHEFFNVITQKQKNKENAVIALTGHTHHSIAYRAQPKDGTIAFWHDYYFDGTVESKIPSQRWGIPLPEYPTPLNLSADPKKWWQEHSPLFIQAISVTAPPYPSREIGFLRFVVQDDVITQVVQESLPLNQKNLATANVPSDQAYFILFSAPP